MNLSLVLNLALPLIRAVVSKPKEKRKMRNLMPEIYSAIKIADADDEAFQ